MSALALAALLALAQTPTPPAQVKPEPTPGTGLPTTAEQQKRRLEHMGAAVGKPEPAHVAQPADKPEQPPVPLLKALDTATIKSRFDMAYANQKRPKIAVFFNRQLSDEVREWNEPQRKITTTATADEVSKNGAPGRKEKAVAETVTPLQPNPVSDERPPLDESQAWAIDTTFSSNLLNDGAQLVNRATIMRLVALNSGKQDKPDAVLAVKHVEMAALVGYADYFVELLVKPSSGPLGVELLARVNEVKTGVMVATVSTATWSFNEPPKRGKPTRKVVATERGHQYVDVPADEPPPLQVPSHAEVVDRLAWEVKQQLAGSWERRSK